MRLGSLVRQVAPCVGRPFHQRFEGGWSNRDIAKGTTSVEDGSTLTLGERVLVSVRYGTPIAFQGSEKDD